RSRFFAGTWHTWRKEKAARELALGRAIERQQAEIERLERFVTRFRAGTRARQAQARQKRLDKIDRITRDPKDGAGLEFAFKAPSRTGRVVLELEDASLRAGDKQLLDDGEMWLERGEHVSLVGMNGTGKTTLIETLAGRRELASGKLRIGHNVEIGYLSQHAEELSAGGARTVLEAAQRLTGLKPGETRALLGRFLFSGEDAEKPLETLSGGERRRLSLAVLVHSGANFLILDEPTNHLDLESREALEAALAAFPGSLLLVSHDRALLDAVGSRTVELHEGELHSYVGGWPEYLRVRAERAAKPSVTGKKAGAGAPKNASAPTPAGAPPGRTARTAGGTKPKTKSRPARAPASTSAPRGGTRARRLEEQIESAEAALAAVEDELADPAAWATPEATARSTARHEEARQRVAELYERYETVAG
ncbi:MAG TPA: ATP-binding cassette domain-containing protein, partial [Solirubrobacteraceae bacterium]|nr:ATP-binding cassette domain-containing protein [Solirubrobacteraceae bacterium]